MRPMPNVEPSFLSSRRAWGLWAAAGALWLAGCSSSPKKAKRTSSKPSSSAATPSKNALRLPSSQRPSLLARAMLVVNTRYTYGGNTPEGGFDCSGLVQYVVRGITSAALPRTTAQWAQASTPVGRRSLERGDFVFFNTLGGRYSHMGIFVGNGEFVHAPSSGGTVQRVRMDNPYFAKRFTEARSIFA